MFARLAIIAAAVAFVSAAKFGSPAVRRNDDYAPAPTYEEPAYTPSYESDYKPKADSYDEAYNYAAKHYAKEAAEDRRRNFERRNPKFIQEPPSCEDHSCYREDFVPRSAPVSNCNTGDLQCCNQVQSAKSVDFEQFKDSDFYTLIPNALRGSNVPVGVDCSPIVDLLGGGNQCNQQPVCCDGGHFSGLFSVNCNAYNGGSQAIGIL